MRDRIRDLFKECDADVQAVLAKVLDLEWARLSFEKPRGIIDEIKNIVDAEAGGDENET